MEEVYVKREISEKRYKAIDGTLFTTESECRKFEETAYCVIKSRLMSIIEETIEGNDVYEHGLSDNTDYTGYVINLDSKDKVDTLNVFLNYHCAKLLDYDLAGGRTIILMINRYEEDSFFIINIKERIEALQNIIDRNNIPF